MYTDKSSIENYLLIDIDSSFNDQITAWIEAVSSYIDQHCNRAFEADEEATTRLFDIGPSAKLLIDDATEITKVEIGDRYGEPFEETTEYVALPLNSTPKISIALKNRSWPVGIHRITAKWGYSEEVPADIKFAATVLTAGIINTQVKTGTAKKSERIGSYSVEYTDDKGIADYQRAIAILDTYRRVTL